MFNSFVKPLFLTAHILPHHILISLLIIYRLIGTSNFKFSCWILINNTVVSKKLYKLKLPK